MEESHLGVEDFEQSETLSLEGLQELPHRCCQNLARRGMSVDANCPHCHLEEESLCHVLFECGISREFWLNSPFFDLSIFLLNLDFGSMLQLTFDYLGLERFELFVVSLWLLWL